MTEQDFRSKEELLCPKCLGPAVQTSLGVVCTNQSCDEIEVIPVTDRQPSSNPISNYLRDYAAGIEKGYPVPQEWPRLVRDLREAADEIERLRGIAENFAAYITGEHPSIAQDDDHNVAGFMIEFGGRAAIETSELPLSQEPKYTVRDGRLVNRATGVPIPDDEPVFILRAKDRQAVYALMDYRSRCLGNADHYSAIDSRVGDFLRFKEAHPERMKQPDTVRAAVETSESPNEVKR